MAKLDIVEGQVFAHAYPFVLEDVVKDVLSAISITAFVAAFVGWAPAFVELMK